MVKKILTEEESKQIKNVIRKNLQIFHNFCEEHNLTYYLSDGTLLGAIRHKGMIPWDDDADICMPRKDYERLLTLVSEIPKKYKLGHFAFDKNYIYPFIKFIDNDTEIIEYFGRDGYYKSGVWVDVFPLDGTFENLTLRKIHYSVVNILKHFFLLSSRKYQPAEYNKSLFNYIFKSIVKPLMYGLTKIVPKTVFFELMDNCAKLVDFEKTEIVGNLYTMIGVKASHKKVWFDNKKLYDFDGYKFYGPVDYNNYLTNLYGDYMTPPPLKDRLEHNIEVVNLINVVK